MPNRHEQRLARLQLLYRTGYSLSTILLAITGVTAFAGRDDLAAIGLIVVFILLPVSALLDICHEFWEGVE